ncbi:MAG: hypothetical protein Fur0022_19420 [Anaerolineales bacterium]
MDFRLPILLLTALPLGFTGLVLASRAWRGQRQSITARQWARVTGRVVTSTIATTMIRQRISTSTGRYRWLERYAPRIEYEYQVGAQRLTGTRLHFGEVLYSSDAASSQYIVNRYRVGSEVMVYYDPANPANAVLMPGIGWGTVILWGLAFLALGIAGWLTWIILTSPPLLLS